MEKPAIEGGIPTRKIFLPYGTQWLDEKRFGKSGDYYYDMQYLGFRYNMSEIHASLGIQQLKKLEYLQKRRR